jgi:hypothetical protein
VSGDEALRASVVLLERRPLMAVPLDVLRQQGDAAHFDVAQTGTEVTVNVLPGSIVIAGVENDQRSLVS